jgi:HAD superfamily hydrolase (TIGR01509 family)
VFDCDGTLLETESRWTIAEQMLCERWDVPFSMELKRRLLGTHISRSGEILADWFGQPADTAPSFGEALIVAYREAVDAHGVEAMPGALELVTALTGRLPMAVASNTNIDDTRRVLARSPLPDVFEVVVCAGGEITPKPAPDVFLAACHALGHEPRHTLAFEDSPVGSAAAMAGGLRVYGVPSTPGVTLTAHVTLTSLRDITARDLLG